MNVLVYEGIELKKSIILLQEISLVQESFICSNLENAIACLKTKNIDCIIAYIDTKDDLNLINVFREIKPTIAVILIAKDSSYAFDAFCYHANGYLLLPVSAKKLEMEFCYLEKMLQISSRKVHVRCFGNFEIFVDNNPLKFSRTKTKELIAYLVDKRGTPSSMSELIVNLWEDKDNNKTGRSMLHNVISDMKQTLKRYNIEDIIFKTRNNLQIDVTKIDCDYYHLLEGDKQYMNLYTGEYMSNYSWAEYTSSFLYEQMKNKSKQS